MDAQDPVALGGYRGYPDATSLLPATRAGNGANGWAARRSEQERALTIFDLLWLFLIFSSLQPLLRQRLLESQRLRAFRQLELRRGSRVIGLTHRRETMSFLGIPIARYIDIEDSERLLRAGTRRTTAGATQPELIQSRTDDSLSGL